MVYGQFAHKDDPLQVSTGRPAPTRSSMSCVKHQIIKGYCTSSRINCGMAKSLVLARACEGLLAGEAITLLLYTCYFTFSTIYVILTRIVHKKQPFRHSIVPNVFLFMPAGYIATARDLGNAAETNNGIT